MMTISDRYVVIRNCRGISEFPGSILFVCFVADADADCPVANFHRRFTCCLHQSADKTKFSLIYVVVRVRLSLCAANSTLCLSFGKISRAVNPINSRSIARCNSGWLQRLFIVLEIPHLQDSHLALLALRTLKQNPGSH